MLFNIPVGGKRNAVVSVYGAASETVTLTHSKGDVFTFTANDGSTKEIPTGTYTVKGNKSGYSKTVTVTKDTARVNAWPDGATIYYWYGYSPVGDWKAVAALPNTSPYTSDPVKPTLTVNTNSVKIRTTGDYARGGSIHLPKTKISGETLHLVCSDSYRTSGYNSYLAFNMTTSMSNGYSPTKVAGLKEGTTSATIDISALSGNSYYLAISANTCGYNGGSKPSYTTVKAIYSVGEVEDVELDSKSETVSIANTYRYGNALQATSGFAKVSSLTFGSINYVGQGTDDYNAMMIPLSGFSFSGKSVWLKLSMYLYVSSANNHTFQWAITTSRSNESVYKGTGSVTDSNQLAQGTFSPVYNNGSYSWQTFLLECNGITSDTPLYIYLWRNNTTYGNLHVMETVTATLEYAK